MNWCKNDVVWKREFPCAPGEFSSAPHKEREKYYWRLTIVISRSTYISMGLSARFSCGLTLNSMEKLLTFSLIIVVLEAETKYKETFFVVFSYYEFRHEKSLLVVWYSVSVERV